MSSLNSSAQQTTTDLADEVKNQLQNMLAFLNKDIIELVQDAEPIRNILQTIKGQLTPELESAIIPTAYIEGHQFKVLQAQQRLADRLARQSLLDQREINRQEVARLKMQVDTLEKAPIQIDQEINQLKAREAHLLNELEEVQAAIKNEEDKLNQLPEAIE